MFDPLILILATQVAYQYLFELLRDKEDVKNTTQGCGGFPPMETQPNV